MKTLQKKFNDIVDEGFWGKHDPQRGELITEAWWKMHGEGVAKRLYHAQEKAIIHLVRGDLIKLLEKNLAEALTCNDPFIREYTKTHLKEVE